MHASGMRTYAKHRLTANPEAKSVRDERNAESTEGFRPPFPLNLRSLAVFLK